MKTITDVQNILNNIRFMDRKFIALPKGDGFLIQLRYQEEDVDTGKVEWQHGRKWYMSAHATTSEIVQTALKACITSMEHIVREHFLYKGERIFGPHHDVEALVVLAKENRLKQDKRE